MMKYEIASSSTEEGEVHENTFPYTKSHLKYFYYPHTNLFIGQNSLPSLADYKSESVCQKLKKDIKANYPYISFNLLDNGKTFFDNSFTPVADLDASALAARKEFKLVKLDTSYKEITRIIKGEDGEKYIKFYQQQFFSKEPPSAKRVFILEDRMLEEMNNPNAYLFFRASEYKETGGRRYVFEDVFYSQYGVYEYLKMYGEMMIRSQGSEEVRVYSREEEEIQIHSSTVFMSGGRKRRLFGVPDDEKNVILVMNMEGAKLLEIQGGRSDGLERLMGVTVGEGDYVINKSVIYKVGDGKVIFEHKGIQYEDLV